MKQKHILTIVLFAVMLFGLSVWNILRPSKAYSMTERRSLAQMPIFSVQTVMDGSFMDAFETYTLDQFPMRDGFRMIKAANSCYVFRQLDNHGIYYADGHLSKRNDPLHTQRVARSVQQVNRVWKRYLSDTQCKIYLSIIPDKNVFLAPSNGYPVMDYSALIGQVRDGTSFAVYLDIFDSVDLSSYYHTDQHWRQECLSEPTRILTEGMHTDASAEYTEHTLDVPFYGAYAGQYALKLPPDTIHYLTNSILEHCIVTDYRTGVPQKSQLYDFQRGKGKDPYDFFLSGADPLITIENPNAKTDRELVIFRDSFGSSIAPLLIPAYQKITLIDLRYLRSDRLGDYISFDNQDVLFLYSTMMLNQSIAQD